MYDRNPSTRRQLLRLGTAGLDGHSVWTDRSNQARMDEVQAQILAIVAAMQPVKAKAIAEALTTRLGRTFDRGAVNSQLYGAIGGYVEKDPGTHEWKLRPPSPGPPSEVTAPSQPADDADHGATTIPDLGPRPPKIARPRRPRPTPKPDPAPLVLTDGTVASPEQQRLIAFELAGNLLLRGEAGAGKTTVLAARHRWLHHNAPEGTLLFLTYNRALADYVEGKLSEPNRQRANVKTYHEWASGFAGRRGLRVQWDTRRRQRLSEMLEVETKLQPEARAFRLPVEFWSDELAWVWGRGFDQVEEYLEAPRVGRGGQTLLKKEERALMWSVFMRLRAEVESEGRWDIDDPGGLVRIAMARAGGEFPEVERFDHVLIDEVQDFDRSWLHAIAPIARKSLTMAGDLAQRIFRRHFTWKEVGISISGSRSRRLVGTYRTTRPIMELAVHLAVNPDLKANEDYLPPTVPDKDGAKVLRISGKDPTAVRKEAIKRTAQLAQFHPHDTVVLAHPFDAQLRGLEESLQKMGVEACKAKGERIAKVSKGVLVTTYHQLKGLEFDHVVLMGLEDQAIPNFWIKSLEGEDRVEEENTTRRLVYMAMTRAKKTLTLCGAQPFCRFFDAVPAGLFEDR